MKAARKPKKAKQSQQLKDALCDIVKKLDCLKETSKKMEELSAYCSGEQCRKLEIRR